MKKTLIFSILISLAVAACEKPELDFRNDDELIGYWQFIRFEPDNGRVYARVPNDDGLNDMQKSLMLRFLAPDQFGEFFWNWCGTPPALPSDWLTGTWQRRTDTPEVVDLNWDGNPSTITILELQPDSLFARFNY